MHNLRLFTVMGDSAHFWCAALPWMQELTEASAKEVFDKLDNSLRYADPKLELVMRGDTVYDARGQWVMAAAESLSRWDGRPPTEIFRNGFVPRIAPKSIQEFRQLKITDINLVKYVVDNTDSVFVSATRHIVREGKLKQWSPALTRGRYEYEIFAYGGIDVNLTLQRKHSPFQDQEEITFCGGVRPGLIRSAREYDAKGRVVRVWRNLHFDPLLSRQFAPPATMLPLLPNIVDTANFLILDPDRGTRALAMIEVADESVDVERGEPEEAEQILTNAKGSDVDERNGNFDGYKLEEDPWMAKSTPLFPLERASMLYTSGGKSQAYFFADTRFVPINLVYDGSGNLKDTIAPGGVQALFSSWPATHKAMFTQLDAILPDPRNADQVYFFCKTQYAVAKLSNKSLVDGPKSITAEWKALRESQFDSVDAVMPNYDNNGEAFIFRGKEYVRIKIKTGPKDSEVVTKRGNIKDHWPSLKKAGLDTVDAVLPSSYKKGQTYFFSGDLYVLVNVNWGKLFFTC